MTIYDKTITILNKLKATDSLTKQDIYYKKVLDGCGWYEEAVSDVNGSTAFLSTIIKVYIPFNKGYLPYKEWKDGNTDTNFTISQGDVIILGEVTEDVNVNNLAKVKKNYEPSVCEVRFCRVCDKRDGVEIQLQVQGV